MRETKSSRILAFLLAALLLLGVFSTGGAPAFADGEDDRTTFTVGFDAEFPPYGYKDTDGEYIGFDLDLAAEVCKRRGWTLVKQPIDWDSKDMELNSGTIDCIWNGFTIQGREEDYTWTEPYVDNSQVVVVRASSDIQKPADLAGKVVIVQTDSSALAAFTGEDAEQANKDLAASFAELQQVADYNSAFMNLEAGAADAVCLDIGVAKHELANRGDAFRMLDSIISTEQYGVGFKLGNTSLRDVVQESINEMAADGTFMEIAKIWDLSDSVCIGKTPEAGTDTVNTEDVTASEDAEDPENSATNVEKKSGETFTVGFDAEFPPYGYKDTDGEYIGFDLDLAAEVCKRRGWNLVKQPIDWDSKDMELSSGTIDCIWNGFTIQGRESDYTWSVPYVDNSQVVVVRTSSDIQKPEDLSGKVVIVQTDSSALAAFTGAEAEQANKDLAATFAELQQVADYNSAFMNLEAGAADAVCLDIGVAKHELANRGDSFRMLDAVISTEQYGVGFKLGNTKLRDQVQETLNEMATDGTFAEIAKTWDLSDSVCLGKEKASEQGVTEASDPGEKSTEKTAAESSGKKSFFERFGSITKQLGKGMLATLAIFFLTLIFSMPLGLLLTAIRMSRFKVLQWIAKIYISILRGTPLMLQLLVVFFGPHFVFGIETSSSYRFYAVIIGFSLNYAAYFAEIFRAGIEGVPVGQHEAADVLGYTRTQTFWKIIFPQMVKRVIPPVTNEVITLVKDTSLAFALAYTEMFTLAKQVTAAESSIMPLFIAGLFYYVFNILVAAVMSWVEKKMRYYDRHQRVSRREQHAKKKYINKM
ncbi:MAG: ABC transporter permease subunit [Eubacterium sp.]|nr:ABC transporter permease subunit [Eubacterium sp.]